MNIVTEKQRERERPYIINASDSNCRPLKWWLGSH